MALKPVFPRKPLMDAKEAALSLSKACPLGLLHEKMTAVATALSKAALSPCVLAALMPAAYILSDEALQALCHKQIMESAFMRGEAVSLPDAILLSKAVMAWYEAETDKALLEPVMKFLKPYIENDAECLLYAGEMIELVIWLYNITGKRQLLKLIDSLRQNAMDWTSALHTFAMVKPFDRMFNLNEVKQGIEKEAGDISGFYTRQHHLAHGPTLGMNLKTPALFAMVSGSGKEKEAPMTGYKKLMRYHGVAGGIFTANPYLNGQNFEGGTDVRAIGEMAHSLSVIALLDKTALPALEKVVRNSLMASLRGDTVQRVHYVNENGQADGVYVPIAEAAEYGAAALKGLVAYVKAMATVTKENALHLNLLTDSRIDWKAEGAAVRVTTTLLNETYTVKVLPSKEFEGCIVMQIPPWAGEAYATVDGLGAYQADENGQIALQKLFFKKETVIVLNIYKQAQMKAGYRDSFYYEYGADLLAKGAQGCISVPLNGKEEELGLYGTGINREAQFSSAKAL